MAIITTYVSVAFNDWKTSTSARRRGRTSTKSKKQLTIVNDFYRMSDLEGQGCTMGVNKVKMSKPAWAQRDRINIDTQIVMDIS